MKRFKRLFSPFRRNERGVAYIEFALLLPMLAVMFLGTIEVTRYVLITEKVQKVAMTVANVVAQAQAINAADLANIVTAAGQIMQPYPFGASGYVIITSVTQNGAYAAGNPPVVSWQYTGGGSMNPAPGSKVGAQGGTATLPNNLQLNAGDNVIITEVYYNFTPLIATNGILGNQLIYEAGLFKPRLGTLNVLGMLDVLEKGAAL